MSDIIGYIGTLLVVVSFLMKDIFLLRLINVMACVVFVIYGILLSLIPVIITNLMIISINLYFIIKEKK